jgi:hypothetical protein
MIDLPPDVARAFLADMRAYFAETSQIKRDEIAARQRAILAEYVRGRLRVADVKEMFEQWHK